MILAVHERWGPRARLTAAVLVAAALLWLPACGSDDGASNTTVPTTPTTTQPESDDDPWAVPATITEAYVQRILDELARLEGEALREIVRERAFTERSLVLLGEVFTAAELPTQLELIQDALDGGLEGVRDEPGDPAYRLETIRSASPECIFTEVRTDLGQVVHEPTADPPLEFLTLRRGERRLDENESGWLIDELFFLEDGEGHEAEDGCDFE